eukprot:gene20366-24393_t
MRGRTLLWALHAFLTQHGASIVALKLTVETTNLRVELPILYDDNVFATTRALRVEDNAVVVVAAPTPSDSLVGKTFLHAIVTAQEKPKLVKRLMRDPAPVEAAL